MLLFIGDASLTRLYASRDLMTIPRDLGHSQILKPDGLTAPVGAQEFVCKLRCGKREARVDRLDNDMPAMRGDAVLQAGRKIGDYGRFQLLSPSCAEPVFSIWLWRKGDSTQYSQ